MAVLAPPPDFRHVSLAPDAAVRGPWGIAATTAALSLGVAPALGLRAVAWAGLVLSVGALAASVRGRRRRRAPTSASGRAVAMAIVPWGVIVEDVADTRILRWSAVDDVRVETRYGRDQATDVTKGSTVTVAAGVERLVGVSPDAVPLERLLAHRAAYADESAHVAALDLEGDSAAGEAWEPQAERLLLACQHLLGAGARALGAASVGYRGHRPRAVGDELVGRLKAVLRDRRSLARDPRPLAAMLAAELGLRSLADDVASLVASPHALTAATARVAGAALGLAPSRLGVLDEVAPFLPERDVSALSAFSRLVGPEPAP